MFLQPRYVVTEIVQTFPQRLAHVRPRLLHDPELLNEVSDRANVLQLQLLDLRLLFGHDLLIAAPDVEEDPLRV